MGPVTGSLIRLQEIESQLWNLRESLAAKARSVTAQERKIQQMQAQLDQKTDQLKHMQADAANQELDIKAQEAEIGKLRNALNTAKTNKEYDAILHQIGTDRTEVSRDEEKVLALLSQIDQVQAECSQARQDIQQGQTKLQALVREQEQTSAASAKGLSELEQVRAQVADKLPPDVLKLFERVGRNYSGQAMAVIIQNGRKQASYSCSGCHMGITVDTVSLLMSKDEVRQCPNCQRLLYIEPK